MSDPGLVATGRVIWITGFPGAGKSTIARYLWGELRRLGDPVVLLDGDELRRALGVVKAFGIEDRTKLAMTYARLGKLLADQGLTVVCATVSLFAECHRWNRDNIRRYTEVYVRAPGSVLMDRTPLYRRALAGEIANVPGVDLGLHPPQAPDLVLDNGADVDPAQLAAAIIRHVTGGDA